MDKFLDKLRNKKNLSFDESVNAFQILMDGKANDDEIFKFLTYLSEKGEVSDEIAGGVAVLRDKATKVNVQNCIDTCGTGGDGKDTLNISTASALYWQVWESRLQNTVTKQFRPNAALLMF